MRQERQPAHRDAPDSNAAGEDRRLAEGLRVALRYAGTIERAPAREGDVEASVLSPEKAERVFGWRAAVELQAGLQSTAAWFQQHR